MGGFGSAVLEAFHREGWDAANVRVHAIPDQFVEHSPAAKQRASFHLDPAGVVETVLALFPDLARAAAPAKGAQGAGRENLVETVTW
jgi:deoxyxylulose-5-phosphate synthase